MKNKFTSAPNIVSTSKQSKDTQINRFLKAIPHLTIISTYNILVLAQRFSISPEMLASLIQSAASGGAFLNEK
ncbi:MAG: hypothetical protein IPO70_06805 [Bacteroidetes bacterium]|nr:hypothetical protein [Bacteroidota bacterium]